MPIKLSRYIHSYHSLKGWQTASFLECVMYNKVEFTQQTICHYLLCWDLGHPGTGGIVLTCLSCRTFTSGQPLCYLFQQSYLSITYISVVMSYQKAELATLRKKTSKDLWIEDLDAFEAGLKVSPLFFQLVKGTTHFVVLKVYVYPGQLWVSYILYYSSILHF